MMILKLIGVAFERNTAMTKIQRNSGTENEISNFEREIQNISSTELLHYSFNYIGLLVGKHDIKVENEVVAKAKNFFNF